jgi:hypothetical protein
VYARLPAESVLVVSTRPRAIESVITRGSRRVVALGHGIEYPAGSVVLTDPDGWQANWAAATALSRQVSVIFHECSVTEFRQLSRQRKLPPPLAEPATTAWMLNKDGAITRVKVG